MVRSSFCKLVGVYELHNYRQIHSNVFPILILDHLCWNHLECLLKMLISGPQPKPVKSESAGMIFRNLDSNKL